MQNHRLSAWKIRATRDSAKAMGVAIAAKNYVKTRIWTNGQCMNFIQR